MAEHEITAVRNTVETVELGYNGTSLFVEKTVGLEPDGELHGFNCSCGLTFDSFEKAQEHAEEVNSSISSDDIVNIISRIRNNERVRTGQYDNGEIIQHGMNGYYAVIELEDDSIVFKFSGRDKVRHKNDTRLQTKEVFVVSVTSYLISSTDYNSGNIEELVNEGKKLESGYTPPYRTDSAEEAIEKTLRYYSVPS